MKGISGFIERKVKKSGSGAMVDCPKGFLRRMVYPVITREKE